MGTAGTCEGRGSGSYLKMTAEALLTVLAGATSVQETSQSSLLLTKAHKAPNPQIFLRFVSGKSKDLKASGLNKPGLQSIKKWCVQDRTDQSFLSHRYFDAVIINGEKNVLCSVK